MRALHLRNLTSFPTRRSSDLATDHAWTLISDQGVGAPTEEVVAQGLEESKKFIRVLVEAQRELAGQSAKEVQRSEEHTSELQSRGHLVCRLLLEKKNN